MNFLEDLARTACVSSCGACTGSLCPNCRKSTMKANGLPEEWSEELVGLDHRGIGYASGYSEAMFKVMELRQKAMKEYKKKKLATE